MKKIFLPLLCSISFLSFSQFKESIQLDSIFATWDQLETPGAALGIVKDGELIYAKGYGSADLEHDLPITPSSVFYIGSVSKQFVTFCILLLEEQGKLDLDDKIQKYLPDFPEYEAPLTIRHFIHHTSGVRDYLTLMDLKGRSYLDNLDVNEVYELIKRQKELNFTPGEKYLYSNSCYFMLAMIVEKVSHESIRKFAHEHIFAPLGMQNTLFYDDNTDLIKNRVFSYQKKKEDEGFDNLIMRFDLVGSGGVYSSIEDLFLWDQNFYHNILGKGGQDIIKKMHQEGVLNNGESAGYAFALNNGTYKGLRTVSHAGALAGYRAQLLRFPDEKFSVIILANRDDANPTGKSYQVADILLKGRFKEEPPKNEVSDKKEAKTTKEKEMDMAFVDVMDYVGNFYSEELDATYKLYVENDLLKLKIVNNEPQDLEKVNEPDSFISNGNRYRFERTDGKVIGFKLDAGRVTNLKFKKQ
ncbi:MAG: serine hydrolase domain-containing protein [Bacteroidota bacterium]|nr:serine hydrolase domain-containing protein [Bacteroidota bacterium]